jgi:integrase
MFLSKSPSRFYYIYFNDERGKRQKISTRCTLKTDALKFLQTFKIVTDRKPRIRKTHLLSEFTINFLSFAEGSFSQGTVGIYRFAMGKLLSIAGDIPIASLSPQHFDNYKVERLKTVSPTTVNIDLRTLRAALNTALRWGLIERNPFAKQRLVPVVETTPVFFSREDFQKLISFIKESWLKELVIFAVLTGMRRGEITNLRWQDVDMSRKILTIQSSPTFKTKNGKRRIIPMNETAFYLLTARHGKDVSEYVFTHNGKRISEGWLTHVFKKAVYDVRLRDDRLHFHSLRHTFASWLVQDGVSIYAVK